MKRLITIFTAMIMLFSLACFSTSCLDGATPTDVVLPDYSEVSTTIDTYRTDYFEYMKNNSSSATYNGIDGFIPSDTPCQVTYMSSSDNEYVAVTIETIYDTSMNIDEYYFVSDSMLFIARTSLTDANDPNTGVVTKYVVIDDVLYTINDAAQTIEIVTKPDSLDLYLSETELTELYAPA